MVCAPEVRNLLERFGGPIGALFTLAVAVGAIAVSWGALGLERRDALSAAGGVLALGGVGVGIACRRSFGRWTAPGVVALTFFGLIGGAAAALVPAVVAPRGFDPSLVGPCLVVVLVALGLLSRPQNRMLWWVPCGLGMGFAAWLGFAALPGSPGLARYEQPPVGSDVAVDWSADGAVVSIVYPLDEPVTVTNAKVRRRDAEDAEARLGKTSAVCPDSDGEENAAAEAVISGDRGQAIARARLALQICAEAVYARQVLGSSLLARGVTRMRSGQAREAVTDLEEALELVRDNSDLARAHLALGRTLETLDRSDEAKQHFETAAELAPSHPAGRPNARNPRSQRRSETAFRDRGRARSEPSRRPRSARTAPLSFTRTNWLIKLVG